MPKKPLPPSEIVDEIADVDEMISFVRKELDFRFPLTQQASIMHRIGALLDQRGVLMHKRDGLPKDAPLS